MQSVKSNQSIRKQTAHWLKKINTHIPTLNAADSLSSKRTISDPPSIVCGKPEGCYSAGFTFLCTSGNDVGEYLVCRVEHRTKAMVAAVPV